MILVAFQTMMYKFDALAEKEHEASGGDNLEMRVKLEMRVMLSWMKR